MSRATIPCAAAPQRRMVAMVLQDLRSALRKALRMALRMALRKALRKALQMALIQTHVRFLFTNKCNTIKPPIFSLSLYIYDFFIRPIFTVWGHSPISYLCISLYIPLYMYMYAILQDDFRMSAPKSIFWVCTSFPCIAPRFLVLPHRSGEWWRMALRMALRKALRQALRMAL